MLTDRELWERADRLVAKHNNDAPVVAAMRCDELLDAGDYEGARIYQEIILRINRLLKAGSRTAH